METIQNQIAVGRPSMFKIGIQETEDGGPSTALDTKRVRTPLKLLAFTALLFFVCAMAGTVMVDSVRLSPGVIQSSNIPEFAMSSPICPTGFWIAQRHDKRNAKGEIIRAHWRIACLTDRK